MPIRAIYENGVFRPLEDVKAREGTEAEVYLRLNNETAGPPSDRRALLEDLEAYGIWKDRDDFTDGVDYVNQIRKYRRT